MRDFKSMETGSAAAIEAARAAVEAAAGAASPATTVNRAFDSNGPDGVKIRGHAQHVFEKYQQLARDAGASGDRVLAENYLQHAEHYFRVLRAVQPQRPASEIIGRDAFTSGIDIDFEDEGGGDNENDGGDGGEDVSDTRDQQRQDNNNGAANTAPTAVPNTARTTTRAARTARTTAPRPAAATSSSSAPIATSGLATSSARGTTVRVTTSAPATSSARATDRQRSYRDDRRDRYEPRGEQRAEGADPLAVIGRRRRPLTRSAAEDASPSLRSQDGSLSPAPAFLQSRVEGPPPPRARTPPNSPAAVAARPPRRAVEDNQPEPAEADEG
ncbi:MAG: DUF4167 domain-containing protein [Caulobacteraceae bacterium]